MVLWWWGWLLALSCWMRIVLLWHFSGLDFKSPRHVFMVQSLCRVLQTKIAVGGAVIVKFVFEVSKFRRNRLIGASVGSSACGSFWLLRVRSSLIQNLKQTSFSL
jgi:hypothetical protein